MISIVYNSGQNAIEIYMDKKGVDLLIQNIQEIKRNEDHVHIYATGDDGGLSLESPYREKMIFGELILTMLPSDAWK